MVRAQDPLAVGEGRLVQGDGVAGASRRFVGVREVVPRGQRAGVVRAQDPLAVGQGALQQRNSPRDVADLVQVPPRPGDQAGQVLFDLAGDRAREGTEVVSQGRDLRDVLLHQGRVPPGVPGIGQDRPEPADRIAGGGGQGSNPGVLLPDDPHHQPVR